MEVALPHSSVSMGVRMVTPSCCKRSYCASTSLGAAVGAAHGTAFDPERAYTFGLDRVLDGLEALISAERTKRTKGATRQHRITRRRPSYALPEDCSRWSWPGAQILRGEDANARWARTELRSTGIWIARRFSEEL